MGIKFTNFARSTLSVGIDASVASLTVASGQGALFPTLGAGDYFYATIENSSLAREIVKVTARISDVFTIVRAQDGTTGLVWLAGDVVALRLNAAAMGEGFASPTNWVDGGGTADAITATYSPAIPTLADGQLCFFRATAANATTTPTFSPNGLTARTIVKGAGSALVAGDIAGDQAEIILRYDLANTRWTLLNPAVVATATTATTATNLAGGSAGSIPYQTAANTTAQLAAATGVVHSSPGNPPTISTIATNDIANGAVTPEKTQVGAVPSMVRVNTANGYGSTNTKIRRFTNIVTNVSGDITYADSATLGASFTINTAGVYAISFSDSSTGAEWSGISLNTTQPTVAPDTLAASEVLAISSIGAGAGMSCSVVTKLAVNDVIRPHGGGGTSTSVAGQFTIIRVA